MKNTGQFFANEILIVQLKRIKNRESLTRYANFLINNGPHRAQLATNREINAWKIENS